MDCSPERGLGLARAQLLDVYPRLGDLMARVEGLIARACGGDHGFLTQAARESLTGRGKRLRPILLLLSAECVGGANDSSVAMASLVEMIHAASLIHDDVIDDAASRHGDRSARIAWGSKVSVLLGDYLIAGALGLFPQDHSGRLISGLSSAAARMCQGQVNELLATGRRMSEEEYLQIIRDKTGSLFSYCGAAGVETVGGPAGLGKALARFGESFGVAFQLADDILDLIGSNGQSGKSEGQDLAERKWTLPLIYAYQQGEEPVRDRLASLLASAELSVEMVEMVREIAWATRAIGYAWGRVEEWLRRARDELADAPACRAKQALLALAGERFPMPVMT